MSNDPRIAVTAAPEHHADLNDLLKKFEEDLKKIGFEVEHALVRLFHKEKGPLVVQVAEKPKAQPAFPFTGHVDTDTQPELPNTNGVPVAELTEAPPEPAPAAPTEPPASA